MATQFIDTLSTDLVTHITAMCGEEGTKWFERLPELIAELEAKWDLNVDDPFAGNEYNFVAAATKNTGEAVVVKIAPPLKTPEIFAEARYLQSEGGAFAVKLLEEDRERRAILIERALPGDALFQHFSGDPAECIPAAIKVLQSIRRPPPTDMTDVNHLDNWFTNFTRSLRTEFQKVPTKRALEIYARLSDQPGQTGYLHGDFHPGNIVSATRRPFLVIDPKGLVGHIGYDIAVFINNLFWWQRDKGPVEELLGEAIGRFAHQFHLSENEVREWCFAYMVIGAWWNFEDMPDQYDADVALTDVWGV